MLTINYLYYTVPDESEGPPEEPTGRAFGSAKTEEASTSSQQTDSEASLKRDILERNRGLAIEMQLRRSCQRKRSPKGWINILLAHVIRILKEFSLEAWCQLRKLLDVDLQIYATLRRLQGRLYLPLVLAMDDCFYFVDALGRGRYLSYQLCRHWEVFTTFLRCDFRGLPGDVYVQRNQFRILNVRIRGQIIDESTWNREIFPRYRIKMSMVIADAYFDASQCPRPWCGKYTNSDPGTCFKRW